MDSVKTETAEEKLAKLKQKLAVIEIQVEKAIAILKGESPS